MGGVTIPAGAQVIITSAAANRRGALRRTRRTLDIERTDVRHLAFGHGIHFCLGAPLARMEGQLALGTLLARFPHLRLAVPVEDLHWGHGDGLVLRGLSDAAGRARSGGRTPVVSPSTRADVVIVGGGLLGLATVYALRGERTVTVLERETVGHARGGSHGESRIFRLGYPDARVRRDGPALRSNTGGRSRRTRDRNCCIRRRRSRSVPAWKACTARPTAAGAPVARLSAIEVAQRFPAFAEPRRRGAGTGVSGDRRRRDTCTYCASTAERRWWSTHMSNGSTSIRYSSTATLIEAETVVVCAGPWARTLIPDLATNSTLEHVAYLRVDDALPIFIDFTEPAVYGLPTPGTDRYKIAVHHGGPPVDPDVEFTPDPAAIERLRAAIVRWLPAADLVEIDVCPYDNTADEAFVVERRHGVVVGAGTSGHAFKFGPLLGEQLAARARAG